MFDSLEQTVGHHDRVIDTAVVHHPPDLVTAEPDQCVGASNVTL